MRRLSAVFALLALIVNGAPTGKASPAQGSERGHPVLQLGANKIEVDHGRPSLRGRNPEEMIKPGQAWRMGSDDPTTLTTQASLKFGDKVITAGKYILQAKLVEPQNWHLLIESESGSLSAEVPLTLQRLDKPVEYLTIALEKQDKGGR
ncbi:MAG TPA: DUF2911 domain-containing protein, partial [Blastocatellia bacterium]|nr:DUF2911 domain-containing protein [Blastocatellia bacterium]